MFSNQLDRVHGMKSVPEVEEHKEAREESAEMHIILEVRYFGQVVKTSVFEGDALWVGWRV